MVVVAVVVAVVVVVGGAGGVGVVELLLKADRFYPGKAKRRLVLPR